MAASSLFYFPEACCIVEVNETASLSPVFSVLDTRGKKQKAKICAADPPPTSNAVAVRTQILVVKAFAATANVVTLTGYVNRIA